MDRYSTFSDIFDEAHFINSLEGDVRVVKELPKDLDSVPRARKHFTSWASMGYYEEMKVLWKDFLVCSLRPQPHGQLFYALFCLVN